MKIAIAQIDPVVGAFEANIAKIRESYERACDEHARLLLTPEMSVCGYPPHDLMDRPEMLERNERALEVIAKLTLNKKTALAVGHVSKSSDGSSRGAQNSVSIFENGKCIFTQSKTLLPTYDVFDEARYFEPASEIRPFQLDHLNLAIAICEDLWGENSIKSYEKFSPDLMISCSASPYEYGKCDRRESIHQNISKKLNAPLFYVNQTGATDEILFDGGSFVTNREGEIIARHPYFKTAFSVFEVDSQKSLKATYSKELIESRPSEIEILAVPCFWNT